MGDSSLMSLRVKEVKAKVRWLNYIIVHVT